MRKVLLLERSEAGVCVRAGEGVEVMVREEWFGERRVVCATVWAIGVVCVYYGRVRSHESPRRAGFTFV